MTTASTTLAASLGIAMGNTLEVLSGAFLVRRFCGGRAAFERVRTIFLFLLLAAVLSTTISATIDVTAVIVVTLG